LYFLGVYLYSQLAAQERIRIPCEKKLNPKTENSVPDPQRFVTNQDPALSSPGFQDANKKLCSVKKCFCLLITGTVL
jgi:hypothetical protein